MVPVLQFYGHALRKRGGTVPYHVPGVTAALRDDEANLDTLGEVYELPENSKGEDVQVESTGKL
jgi:hypothetical protein